MRDNIGGTAFGGTSADAQTSIPYLPSDFALKFAVFADAGSVSGGNILALRGGKRRRDALVGRRRPDLGSPFGPIRVDYATPLTKTNYDVTQRMSFSAGGFY
jgi:outer membrane protein insertion porin family